MEKKKVLLFTYSKANFGDDLFVYILANRYKNIEFYIQIQEPKYKISWTSPKFIGEFYKSAEWYGDLYYTNKLTK